MASPSGANLPAAIGRYQIHSLIGRGGMGEVYGAFDPHLDRYVALKTIQPGQQDASLVARLKIEARAIGRLHHRGIVTIHDLGEAEGKLFIAMEWLQGRSLAQAIKAEELTFATKLQILVEVLEALSYAHGQGIVHRDIKPNNVWVQPDGHVKLLDFGLARFTQTDGLTLTGDVMGTPLYMSPEQLKGKPVDGRSDVYSCGVTGYELLSRRRPFEAESITAIIIKVLSDTPPPLGTAWSIALPEIEALIAKAMSKSPDDRFASADEMAGALRAFINAHQEDIQRIDREIALETTLIVSEVQAMRARGLEQEAKSRLTSGLAQNPDATDLRTLIGEKVGGYAGVPQPPDFRAAPKAPVHGSVPTPPVPSPSSAAPVQAQAAPAPVEKIQLMAPRWPRLAGARLVRNGPDPTVVHLVAKPRVTFGSSGELSDIALVFFSSPQTGHSASETIQPMHFSLEWRSEQLFLRPNAGASVSVDGRPVPVSTDFLLPDRAHIALGPGSLGLKLRIIRIASSQGIDVPAPALTAALHRVGNAPQIQYVLLHRSLAIGTGEDAGVALEEVASGSTEAVVTIADSGEYALSATGGVLPVRVGGRDVARGESVTLSSGTQMQIGRSSWTFNAFAC